MAQLSGESWRPTAQGTLPGFSFLRRGCAGAMVVAALGHCHAQPVPGCRAAVGPAGAGGKQMEENALLASLPAMLCLTEVWWHHLLLEAPAPLP